MPREMFLMRTAIKNTISHFLLCIPLESVFLLVGAHRKPSFFLKLCLQNALTNRKYHTFPLTVMMTDRKLSFEARD